MNVTWANKTPEEKEEYNKKRREKYAQDTTHRASVNAQNTKWAKANREKINARLRSKPENKLRYDLKKYGLTLESYDRLLLIQKNRCACCGTEVPGGRGRFIVDHDHVTGEVRGLLCNNCNLGIGHLGDTVEGLQRAINYLERAKNEKSGL